jgi:hypothetical protein
MFSRFRNAAVGAAALAFAAGFAAPAEAAFVFTMQQVGSNVVVNGSGSINTTGVSTGVSGSVSPGLEANNALLVVGGATTTDFLNPLSGPTNFGPGTTLHSLTQMSGDTVGIIGVTPEIEVPHLSIYRGIVGRIRGPSRTKRLPVWA